jgi:hypothetical protein
MRVTVANIVGTAALGLLACSSGTHAGSDAGGATNTDSCRLIMTLSGEVSFQSNEESVRCMSVNNVAPELLAIYVPNTTGVVTGIGIAIVDLPIGEVGTAYSATLNIEHSDGRTFYALNCSVDVAADVALATSDAGTRYRVAGQGQCSGPALAKGGSITISPFEFAIEARR